VSTDAPASPNPGLESEVVESEFLTRHTSTRVVSAKISLGTRLKNIWECRELLKNLIATEIKVKYKGSVLGLLWSMVAPAMTLLIFWFVFGIVLRNGIPNFVVFLFSGLLFWNFFQLGTQTATGIIVARAGIVKKVAFPREILALACVGTAGVFLFFQTIVLVIFMVALGVAPDWPMVPLLFLTLFTVALMASALGIALSAINVYLRDMSHLIEVILTAWFWACPIVYSYASAIGPHLHHAWLKALYLMNPMTPVVLTAQRVIYNSPVIHLTTGTHQLEQILPTWSSMTYVWMNLALLVFGVASMLVALVIFGRLEGNFAEEL
jgi:ABC-2 type transport system permease protein